MFSTRITFRAFAASWILGAILFLVPLASVLAGGAGTNFP